MADQNNPLVSIIIPSFNQGQFIRQTIESCLGQDYRPIEIIVMDGASTDNTVEVLKSFGNIPELKWISEPDDGVVDAVNKGLGKARGEIAAIQSSDDYYLPGAFSVVVDRFKNSPDAGLVFGNVKRVNAEGRHIFSINQKKYSLARLLSREVVINQQSCFFRRTLALELGAWNPAIPYVPDTDLWFRLAFRAPVKQCDIELSAGRSHPGQRDTNSKRIYADYMRMLTLSRELKKAPMRLRRAAHAGAAMLKFRYGGPWTGGQLTRAAWIAVVFRPALLRSSSLQKHLLVPGYFTLTRCKKKLGCWLHERWKTELVLSGLRRGRAWLDLCNRNETVTRHEDGIGRICQWNDSSFLTVAQIFPKVGKRLLQHVWPAETCPSSPVSIILPVRGVQRLEAVRFVAESFLKLADPGSEVMICEHDVVPQYNMEWPAGVTHVFIPAEEGVAFNKSRAMNKGALLAHNPLLVLHDADVIPPQDYLFQCLEKISQGWSVVRPIRFLFLLNKENSEGFLFARDLDAIDQIEDVQQNNPGLSTVISRELYIQLGGHDERFWGWGGEDAEFLDRLQMIRLYPGSFLPGIHLWHPAAPEKRKGQRNKDLFAEIMKQNRAERIAFCRANLEEAL